MATAPPVTGLCRTTILPAWTPDAQPLGRGPPGAALRVDRLGVPGARDDGEVGAVPGGARGGGVVAAHAHGDAVVELAVHQQLGDAEGQPLAGGCQPVAFRHLLGGAAEKLDGGAAPEPE